MTEQTVTFDRKTRRRFVGGIKVFLTSEVRWKARGLFALLIAFALATNGLNVVNSYVGRDFITAIADRNRPGFIHQAALYIGVFAGSTIVLVLYQFTQDRFGLFWRVWLTRRIVRQYLADRTYLRIKQSATVANPDERIADDVRAFTATTLSFTVMLVNGVLAVLSFSGVLWTISRPLFGIAIGYACLGTLVTIYLGRPLISLNYRQLDREANFRSNLIHVRVNAESIAVSRREGRLTARLMKSLDDLAKNIRRTISVNRRLGFFTTGYNYLIQIVPALVVAPLFIRGKVEFGVVTQSAMAFSQVVGAFSIIVDQFQSISSFGAVIVRVSALSAAIEKAPKSEAAAITLTEAKERIAYEHLTLASADDGHEVLKDLTAEIPHGTRVLVVGPNETARTALFEATAGIWSTGRGTVVRPPLDTISFLPQQPYLPPGTLRNVLLGEGKKGTIGDDEITTTLREMGVNSIAAADGLDHERDWPASLSLRDQQLLALTRLILARPAFAMLDRLDAVLEPAQLREALRRLDQGSITYVVLAENVELIEQYDAVLEIKADGTWSWKPAERDPSQAAGRRHK